MIQDLDRLELHELEYLRKNINDRINKINQENEENSKYDLNKEILKEKLSQLVPNDWIFMIKSYEDNSNNKIGILAKYIKISDFYQITGEEAEFVFKSDRKSYCISEEESDGYYFMEYTFNTCGFEFFTLRPESWINDYQNAFNLIIDRFRQYLEEDLKNYIDEFNRVIRELDSINVEVEKQLKQ